MPDNPLPTLNAALNLTALIFLILGRIAVKRGQVTAHARLMVTALVVSAMFLSSYLYYHFVQGSQVEYEGAGWMKALYYLVLFPHILLAMVQVPCILAVVWSAYVKNFSLHVKLVRWVWPMWVYVSVTGVLVYLMLYILPHG